MMSLSAARFYRTGESIRWFRVEEGWQVVGRLVGLVIKDK